jgi:UDP-GlcNAc:undecaprenyl-phosphate GlcNAc-1-phosphate transferase
MRALPFPSGTQLLSDPASYSLTVLWVLGLTNGINFIDGVDGLAAGVCAIGAGCLCLIEVEKGAMWAAAASAAVCGACIGFLRYNFHPARIFLGDAGSLLLGFWLATISVAAAAKTAAATTLALPMLVLGVPVVDTLWAIIRRTVARQPVWRADRGHLHHRLLARGLSPQKTAMVLYSVSLLLGLAAVFWARIKG